jgi:hypothetical protein
MKKIALGLAAILTLSATPAVADAGTDALYQQIDRLSQRVAGLDDKVERKNELLACERDNRRELLRAMREGDRTVTVAKCS